MNYSCIKIRKITTRDKDTNFIILLRNKPEVKGKFISDRVITKESHLEFLAKAKTKGDMIYVIENNNELIGQVAYLNIDRENESLEGGAFVINPDINYVGIGAFVEYNMLDYAFSVMGITRIFARVLRANVGTLKLHKNFGFKEEGGVRSCGAINRDKNDVLPLVLLKKDWNKERFKKIFGERVFNG